MNEERITASALRPGDRIDIDGGYAATVISSTVLREGYRITYRADCCHRLHSEVYSDDWTFTRA